MRSWEFDHESLFGATQPETAPAVAAMENLQSVLLRLNGVISTGDEVSSKRSLELVMARLYASTPERMRLAISSIIKYMQGRGRQGECFERVVSSDIEQVAAFLGASNAECVASRHGVLITHDVDYRSGYRNIVRIAEEERARGIRSAFYFLTRSAYKIDKALLNDLCAMGHEVGIHGYDYDLRLAHRSIPYIRERLKRAKEALEQLSGVEVAGFRNHSLMLSRNILTAINDLGFKYDSGIYVKSDSMRSLRWFCWPIKYKGSELWELPVMWPQDAEIFRSCALSDDEALECYRSTLSVTASLKGLACLNFHPSIIMRHWEFYKKFIETLNSTSSAQLTPWEYVQRLRRAS